MKRKLLLTTLVQDTKHRWCRYGWSLLLTLVESCLAKTKDFLETTKQKTGLDYEQHRMLFINLACSYPPSQLSLERHMTSLCYYSRFQLHYHTSTFHQQNPAILKINNRGRDDSMVDAPIPPLERLIRTKYWSLTIYVFLAINN